MKNQKLFEALESRKRKREIAEAERREAVAKRRRLDLEIAELEAQMESQEGTEADNADAEAAPADNADAEAAPADNADAEAAPADNADAEAAPADNADAEVAPVEEAEAPKENDENQEEADDETGGFVKVLKWLLGIVGVTALVGILVMLMLMHFSKDNKQVPATPNNGVVDNTPPSVAPEFDMDAFVVSVENIAKTLTTDEDITANIDVFVEKIGADKLQELVSKYEGLPVQEAIAEYLAFVPEIKMNQYIRNNGLDYNPNYLADYDSKLLAADEAYKNATGKNANGALMSLEGYDTHKANKEAMKALIQESGDSDLLTWYIASNEAYNVMKQQKKDTAAAETYKEEVKLKLVNNVNGSVKLLELHLEQKLNGTNVDTLDYTEVYEEFVLNNYMYVVAN